MKVAIFGRKVNKSTSQTFMEVISVLESFGWTVLLEKNLKKLLLSKNKINDLYSTFESHEDIKSETDLIISIGGDGTFIKTINFIKDSNIPLLGINIGRLGFLSNISKNNIQEALSLIKDKKYVFQKRSLLMVETENDLFGKNNFALNELTIHKKDSASMIKVNASLNHNFLNTYWADGLIISTPTGSTAYNLSCGGPIVTPGCQVHMITPIAPHNLTNRPLVVPLDGEITLEASGRDSSFLLSLDSRSYKLKPGAKVKIKPAPFKVKLLNLEDQYFFNTLRSKMHWGMDPRG